MRRSRALSGVVLVIAGTTGCFRVAPRTTLTPANPHFVYDLASADGARSNLTIAIVAPTVLARDVGSRVAAMQASAVGGVAVSGAVSDAQVTSQVEEMKRQFVGAVKKDLERMMIAKGMHTMGPYDTFDELTFSEKKESDFALVPQIELRVAWPPPASHGPYFKQSGELSVDGEFLLVVSEPLSGQKIWSKRLSVPKRTGAFQVSTQLNTNGLLLWDETKDNRAEVAAQLLEQFYGDLMSTIWKQADVRELASLRPQSIELKQRAAPTMH